MRPESTETDPLEQENKEVQQRCHHPETGQKPCFY